MKLHRLHAVSLAIVSINASAQFSIGDGKPLIAPRAAQAGLMSGRGVFTDPTTVTKYQQNGRSGVQVRTTCVGTYYNNGTDPYCYEPNYQTVPGHPNPTTIVPNYGFSNTDSSVVADTGAWRLSCAFVRAAYVDPVVFPANKGGSSHLHGFYGNINVTPYSTHASLLANPASSCYGGSLNGTGYWFPMLTAQCLPGSTNGCAAVFAAHGIKHGQVFAPDVNIYYKMERGPDADHGSYGGAPMQWVPPGLAMIAGDAAATTNAKFSTTTDGYRWYCYNDAGADSGPLDHIPNAADVARMGNCSQQSPGNGGAGDLKAVIGFPYCWDGVNLDSPGTHNSHVSYAIAGNRCTAAFPIVMPQVELQLHWQIPDDVIPFVRLSSDPPESSGQPAGYTLHADYLEAWMQKTPQAVFGGKSIEDVVQEQCYSKGYAAAHGGIFRHVDCHNQLIGNPDPSRPTYWMELN